MPRKKSISSEAMEILAQVIASGDSWHVTGAELPAIAGLIVAGHLEPGDTRVGVVVRATTSGVRAALAAGIVAQYGTRFDLVGIEPRQRRGAPSAQMTPPLRVVEPKAPDPFAEGMDAAMSGQFVTCHYPEGSQEAQDWAAGYQAGGTAKKYVV